MEIGTRMSLAGGNWYQDESSWWTRVPGCFKLVDKGTGEESHWVFYGTCMVFMMVQDVICVIILK